MTRAAAEAVSAAPVPVPVPVPVAVAAPAAAPDADPAGNPSATDVSASSRKGRQIRWYRTPIDAALLRELSRRSDVRGALQTLGYLGLYATTAGFAIYS